METNLNKLKLDNIVDKVKEPIINSVDKIGIQLPLTGNGTKLCLVDSGVPDHEAIVGIGGHINFTSSETFRDILGHSTVLSGIIAGNKPDTIQGAAPDSTIYFAKASDDHGSAPFDAIIASILWGVVIGVDVITVPFVLDTHNFGLQESINKANECGICVIIASPRNVKYENVLYVLPITSPDMPAYFSDPMCINVPSLNFGTTFLEQKYVTVGGAAIAVALATGACLLAVEQIKRETGAKTAPTAVYKILCDSIAKGTNERTNSNG